MKVNSKEYLNKVYSDPTWRNGYQDAYRRLDKIIEGLGEYDNHLDIGCADGYFTSKYLQKYPDTVGYGIDLSDVVVSQQTNGNLRAGDVYGMPYSDDFFNLIHCGELLEHLEEPQKAINEMARVLKTGGLLVITTPNNEATPYEEHIQTWGVDEVKSLLKDFDIKQIIPDFFNGHLMYIEATKK